MEENLFNKILTRVHADEITTSNYYKDEEFENFIEILNEDIGKFKNYTYDGKAQDLIFKGLKKFSPLATKYGQFLKYLEVEFDKLVVPCIILIPLNFLNDNVLKSDLSLTDNIKLFKTEKANTVQKLKISKKKSALASLMSFVLSSLSIRLYFSIFSSSSTAKKYLPETLLK